MDALIIASSKSQARPGGCADTGGHSCGCQDDVAVGLPELDARAIPHAIRHSTILGAIDGLAAGDGLVLVAPHDPTRLLAQIEDRAPGAFAIEYLQRGPDAWRLSLVRADGGLGHA